MESIINGWYNRTKKLCAYYQDKNISLDKRMKALVLANKMFNRVVKGISNINYLRSELGMGKFEIGGDEPKQS